MKSPEKPILPMKKAPVMKSQGERYYRKGKPERYKVEWVREALEKTAGIPALAAQVLEKAHGQGCTPKTIRNYMVRHPELKEVVDEQVETSLDLAESKLIQSLNKGERWAVCFYLETKGKGRGYTRRHEVTGLNGKAIEVTDARERLIDALNEMGERLNPTEPRPVGRRTNGHAHANGAGAPPAKLH